MLEDLSVVALNEFALELVLASWSMDKHEYW